MTDNTHHPLRTVSAHNEVTDVCGWAENVVWCHVSIMLKWAKPRKGQLFASYFHSIILIIDIYKVILAS